MNNIISKTKEFVSNHKFAASSALVTVGTAVSSVPVFAEGETGYLESTLFSGISSNILADLNTNILPYAWPIFALGAAITVGVKIFKKVI